MVKKINAQQDRFLTEVIEHLPGWPVCRTIIHKSIGDVVIASGEGETLGNISGVDIVVEVSSGAADIKVAGKVYSLVEGQRVVIPAHSRYQLKFARYCRLLWTSIYKNNYADVACV